MAVVLQELGEVRVTEGCGLEESEVASVRRWDLRQGEAHAQELNLPVEAPDVEVDGLGVHGGDVGDEMEEDAHLASDFVGELAMLELGLESCEGVSSSEAAPAVLGERHQCLFCSYVRAEVVVRFFKREDS